MAYDDVMRLREAVQRLSAAGIEFDTWRPRPATRLPVVACRHLLLSALAGLVAASCLLPWLSLGLALGLALPAALAAGCVVAWRHAEAERRALPDAACLLALRSADATALRLLLHDASFVADLPDDP